MNTILIFLDTGSGTIEEDVSFWFIFQEGVFAKIAYQGSVTRYLIYRQRMI